MPDLTSLLQRTFGFPSFRANQEAVCRAATDGRDVLLVMPTGAGKSLCYQLPAIARGGEPACARRLPLIALMDDQAAKLTAHGLRVGRIHSGLSRDDTRQSCRDYLDGTLHFLFIAPERLRVPGFPEMLARRKPSLIAIDEAHCISAWGHDFRPDYRTLGEYLPALRPAPIIALTATATPTVQRDIVAQLQLQNPALFIHGFRRSNLAIEVVEMSKPRRHAFTTRSPREPSRPPRHRLRPLAQSLRRTRRRTQPLLPRRRLSRRPRPQPLASMSSATSNPASSKSSSPPSLSAWASTRPTSAPSSTPLCPHPSKPSTRRSAAPAAMACPHAPSSCTATPTAKCMSSSSNATTRPPPISPACAQVLTDEFLMPEPLAQRLKMDLDTFSKAIEKLIAQGAATIDLAGNVRRARPHLHAKNPGAPATTPRSPSAAHSSTAWSPSPKPSSAA